MLRGIFCYIFSNAIKFSNPGSLVQLKAKKEGGKVRISISDSGIGMDERKLKDIFRTDVDTSTPGTAQEKGTGLGLPLVKTLIERNQGSIELISKLNEGSTFTIILPAL